jgi:hypothetical protein
MHSKKTSGEIFLKLVAHAELPFRSRYLICLIAELTLRPEEQDVVTQPVPQNARSPDPSTASFSLCRSAKHPVRSKAFRIKIGRTANTEGCIHRAPDCAVALTGPKGVPPLASQRERNITFA